MAGRTPSEAFQNYAGLLQRTLSCVTREVIETDFDRAVGVSFGLHVGTGAPSPLATRRGRRFLLTARQRYSIVHSPPERTAELGRYKATVHAYAYAIADEFERESSRTTTIPSPEQAVPMCISARGQGTSSQCCNGLICRRAVSH